MNNKEKIQSLIRYKQTIENSLSSPIPPKHINHPTSYTEYLKNELSAINSKIDALKGL